MVLLSSNNPATDKMYHVRCKVCGWEGYTWLRGYINGGLLYIECQKCGSRSLFVSPPVPSHEIVIGTSVFDELMKTFTAVFTTIMGGLTTITRHIRLGTLTTSRLIRTLAIGATSFAIFFVLSMLFLQNDVFMQIIIGTLGGVAASIFSQNR